MLFATRKKDLQKMILLWSFWERYVLNGILPLKLQSLIIKFARYMFLRASFYFRINAGFQCNVKYLSNDPSKDRTEDCAQS